MHDLQTVLLAEPKHLQVVFRFGHLIDSLTLAPREMRWVDDAE